MAEIPQNSPEIAAWLMLINAEGVGPVTFARILKRFGSPDRALGASISELARVEGIGEAKTAKYGDDIMQTIAKHLTPETVEKPDRDKDTDRDP